MRLWSMAPMIPSRLLLAGALAVASCGPLNPYVAPPDGPRAQVRVVSPSGNMTFVRSAEPASCSSSSDQSIAELSSSLVIDKGSGRRVGIPLGEALPQKLTTEFVVPADRPFVLELSVWRGLTLSSQTECRRVLEFTPRDGGMYEAVLNSRTSTACSIAFTEIAPASGGGFSRAAPPSHREAGHLCDLYPRR